MLDSRLLFNHVFLSPKLVSQLAALTEPIFMSVPKLWWYDIWLKYLNANAEPIPRQKPKIIGKVIL